VEFEFVVDYHWDLGHDWSEELLYPAHERGETDRMKQQNEVKQ